MNYDYENTEFIVCDVETTGLNAKYNRVIEVALIKVKNFEIIDSFTTLINPKCFIPPFITDLTGIKNQDVVDAPTFDQVSYKIQEFIGNGIFVAHNANFDYGFLKEEFLRNDEVQFQANTLCTKRLTKRIYPNLKGGSLSNIAKFLNIENPNPHRAYGDAYTTALVLIKLLEHGKKKAISNQTKNYSVSNSRLFRKLKSYLLGRHF